MYCFLYVIHYIFFEKIALYLFSFKEFFWTMEELSPDQVPEHLKVVPVEFKTMDVKEETAGNDTEQEMEDVKVEEETTETLPAMSSGAGLPTVPLQEGHSGAQSSNWNKPKTGWQNRAIMLLGLHETQEWVDLDRACKKFAEHENVYRHVKRLKASIILYGPHDGCRRQGFTW